MSTRESLDEIRNSINSEEIKDIYVGADKCCRCGCRGKYYRSKDKGFQRALNRVNRLTLGEIESIEREADSYINFSLANNRAITLYFKD